MDGIYVILALQTILCFGALYTIKAFDYADEGIKYLRHLGFEDPKKLNNNAEVLHVLKNRDLPNMSSFALSRMPIQYSLITPILINVVLYVFYPFDELLYPWMAYILVAGGVFYNVDAWLTIRMMRANKRLVSTICNAYYNLTIEYEQNAANLQTANEINMAYDDLMVDINKALEKLNEDTNDADDEK